LTKLADYENLISNQKWLLGLFMQINKIMGSFLVIMWRKITAYRVGNRPKNRGIWRQSSIYWCIDKLQFLMHRYANELSFKCLSNDFIMSFAEKVMANLLDCTS